MKSKRIFTLLMAVLMVFAFIPGLSMPAYGTVATRTVTVNMPANAHFTRDSGGAETQTVDAGNSIEPIVYTAETGYYFSKSFHQTAGDAGDFTFDVSDDKSTLTVNCTPNYDRTITLDTAKDSNTTYDIYIELGTGLTAFAAVSQVIPKDGTFSAKIIAASGYTLPEGTSNADFVASGSLNGLSITKSTTTPPMSSEVPCLTISGTPTADVDITLVDAEEKAKYSVTATLGANMSLKDGSGALSQSDIEEGDPIDDIVIVAAEGYIFPNGSLVKTGNLVDLDITRNSDTQITISGNLENGSADFTLVDAVAADAPEYDVKVTLGAHMEFDEDEGDIVQTGLNGGAIDEIWINSDEDYYFVDGSDSDFVASGALNGLEIVRDGYDWLVIKGVPTADVTITLKPATAMTKATKPTEVVFTGTESDEGKFSGTNTDMEWGYIDGDGDERWDNNGCLNTETYISPVYDGDILLLRTAGDENNGILPSDALTFTITQPAAPTTVVPVDCTSGDNGKLTGLTDAMEYGVWPSWTSVPSGATEITNLEAGDDYYVRYKGGNNSLASEFAGPFSITAEGTLATPVFSVVTNSKYKGSTSVAITCPNAGNNTNVKIYYTTDESYPNPSDLDGSTALYTGPITVDGRGWHYIDAIAVDESTSNPLSDSRLASAGYYGLTQVTVSFAPGDGTGTMEDITGWEEDDYNLPKCTFTAPENREFYAWTTNGSDVWDEDDEKAFGDSDETFTAVWSLKAPTLPAAGTFKGTKTIEIKGLGLDGEKIYYTTDGSDPSAADKYLYTGPFEISKTSEVVAFSVVAGEESRWASAVYTLSSGSGSTTAGGGGGAAGGSDGTTTPTTTDKPATATAETQATMDGNKATATVSADTVNKAIEDVNKQSGATGAKELVLEVKSATGTEVVAAKIPAVAVENIAKSDVATTLQSACGNIAIPSDTMENIAKQVGNSDLDISIENKNSGEVAAAAGGAEKLEKATGIDSEALKNANAIDVNMAAAGNAITTFGGKVINLYVPLTGSQKAGKAYMAASISADGSIESLVAKCVEIAGKLYGQLEAGHLTTFVVTDKEVKNPFTDVKESDYFYQAVLWAVDQKVTSGKTETTFAPNEGCTRAQMVTFLWRAAGSPWASANKSFSDVPENAYYKDAIEWAIAAGITTGISDTKFDPNGAVTREQLASFIYRYAKEKGQGFTGTWSYNLNFTDASKISSWADEAMHWCVMKGVVTGTSTDTLTPQGTATRGQIVTMLYRYFGL